MKFAFFLIAFCLVFLRVYLSWSGIAGRGKNDGTMTISNGSDYEQIKWSGKVRLTDDETGIKSISPGGYLKLRSNDKKLVAESNLQGEISYSLYDDGKELALNDEGKKFITDMINEMFAYGFDAAERREYIYKKGGDSALLNEIGNLKLDNIKAMYFDRLFADSLSQDKLAVIANKIGSSFNNDNSKATYLSKFSLDQLKSRPAIEAYFEAVKSLGSDRDKQNIIKHLIDSGSISSEIFDKIWNIVSRLGSDRDKEDLCGLLIDKGAITEERFDKLLDMAAHAGSDLDKENMYKKLMEVPSLTEEEWLTIINDTQQISSDHDKSNLLVLIAAKMPLTEKTKAAYLKVAKTITADMEYGKAMRAIE